MFDMKLHFPELFLAWLNNCVGHFNHRYFFMFCIYAWCGVIFVMLFGIPVAYDHFFGTAEVINSFVVKLFFMTCFQSNICISE